MGGFALFLWCGILSAVINGSAQVLPSLAIYGIINHAITKDETKNPQRYPKKN